MISSAKIKFIHSLSRKKERTANGLFIAEGPKIVEELSQKLPCSFIVATESWLESHTEIDAEQKVCVNEDELKKVSLMQTPQEVLGLFRIPNNSGGIGLSEHKLCIALDGIQDPGNLGTIIRIADWFGIEHVFCSTGTADVFSPKAIQATMGAIARVQTHYVNLNQEIASLPSGIPVYGTFMNGKTIYNEELSKNGIIIMGNEGSGISPELERYITNRIGIPSFPPNRPTSESLNVAVATAIVCSEFRRRLL